RSREPELDGRDTWIRERRGEKTLRGTPEDDGAE
ncbi:unnamed protein product, partial [marine sediment metagenome]